MFWPAHHSSVLFQHCCFHYADVFGWYIIQLVTFVIAFIVSKLKKLMFL